MNVRYRRRAQRDIDDIHEFIDKRNPRAAIEIVERICNAADRLGVWPISAMQAVRPELTNGSSSERPISWCMKSTR